MEKYKAKLQQRILTGSERSLSLFPGAADFFSNDYLGLSRMIGAEAHAGSTGSRLLSGNSEEAERTEHFLAGFFGAEAALVFNSGYDANLGLFSAVPQRGDTILYDELIHASVRDGVRLSYARSYSFRHNDAEDLRQKIRRSEGTVFVAIESLYSMDGDLAPLEKIAAVCESEGALLIVDEAHSGGVFGSEGKGLCEALSVTRKVFARVITFGKAYGAHGATVLGPDLLIRYLVNFARSFIYTTALPPRQYELIRGQVEKASNESFRMKLQQNIAFFRKLAKVEHSPSDPLSPIQVIPAPGIVLAKELASDLQSNGLAVKAILSPTVPEGQERVRICLHTFNTESEIEKFAGIIG